VQSGCVRYSAVPEGSRLPSPHRGPREADPLARPIFRDRRYASSAYATLDPRTRPAILRGSDDSAEIGAMHSLRAPQRSGAVTAVIDELLPFGRHAGLVTADFAPLSPDA
jgi:hypothetical protein